MENFPVVRIRYDPQDNQIEVGLSDLLQAIGGVPGHGTVTSVSVVTANGVSGTVANPTTTPAITLTLGAITPSSVTTTLVTGLAAPTAAADAANKGYVDSVVAGLTFIPPGARVATTGALTATYSNGTLGVGATLTNSTTQAALTIDGVLTVVADVVLVKNQAAPAQNGIYTVTTVGTGATNWVLTRATNYDQLAEIVSGSYTAVGAGTVNAATLWIMTGSTPITVGTTAIPWTQLNVTGAGSVTSVATGTGLTGGPIVTTGTISVANLGIDTAQLANLAVTTGKLADGAVTYAKMQNVAAVSLLGNPTGSPAAASEITLGAGLAFSGATLTATGTGGTVTSVSVVTANGISGTVATATTTPAITLAIANSSIVLAKLANLAGVSLLGNPTGSPAAPSAITLGTGLSFSGTTLQATGSGGTVTSITAGTGLTATASNPITASGTIAFAAIADQRILANVSGGIAVPTATTLTAIIDTIGSAQGDLLYRDAGAWAVLAPGTSGYLLASQGAAANPHWIAPLSILPSGTAGQVLTTDGATPSFSNTTLKINQHFGAIATDSIVSTTATFNLALNDWHTLTLDHTATTTLALTNPTVGQMFVLRLIQDSTGGCLVNWFTVINWRNGTQPILSTTPGAVDTIAFKVISSGQYDGFSTDSGTGTVTSVALDLADGITGSVADPGTTPVITLGLGAITPDSVTTTTVTGLSSPSAPSDAATKGYVDAIMAGLTFISPGALVATTGALTATYANGTLGVGATLTNATTQAAFSVDGVSPPINSVVLVKNQAAPAQNGIYTLTTVGSGATNWVLTRATNYDQLAEITAGSYTAVSSGTTNAATLWIMTGTAPITVGTTAIVFSQLTITGGGTVTSVATGTGLTGGPIVTTGTVSIAAGGVGTTQLAAHGVTYAKLQNEAAHTLLGNPSGSSASPAEITLGVGLAFVGTTLTSTLTGGTVTSMSIVTANGVSGTVANPTTTPAITLTLGAITPSSVNASGTLAGSNFSGSSSGSNTGDQTITLTGAVSGSGTGSFATTYGAIAGPRMLANASTSGTAAPGATTLSAFIDGAIASTQGDIIYRGSSTWDALAPGTAGQVLKTAGAAANPAWSSTGLKIDSHIGIITADSDGSTITFDLSLTDWHSVTLGGNRTLALSNPTTGQQFTIVLIQDGTPPRTVTWFTTIKWAGGAAPTLTATSGGIDVFTFKCTGSNAYYGFVAGQALA